LFIQKSLKGSDTHGFDHDSVYYVQGKYYLFEYLKCESDKVSPHTSNPKYYPYNWKKFWSLWQTAKRLNAYLLLINYSDRKRDSNQVKVMYVKDFDYEALEKYLERSACGGWRDHCEYLVMDEYKITFEQYSEYLCKINSLASLPSNENDRLQQRIMAYVSKMSEASMIKQPILPR
jgi:hypothetical protein